MSLKSQSFDFLHLPSHHHIISSTEFMRDFKYNLYVFMCFNFDFDITMYNIGKYLVLYSNNKIDIKNKNDK